MNALDRLVAMTRELANPEHRQLILAEGNTSARDGDNLWIKASGHSMSGIDTCGFVQVSISKVIDTLDKPRPLDDELRTALNDARTDPTSSNIPSTETFMHAWLLTLPGVSFVAHTHPTTTLAVMCSPRAKDFAAQRLFPDHIVLCGPESVFVAYSAPGFDLAVAIRTACEEFTQRTGLRPKTILLENHGLIALGETPNEALSACLMTEKAAEVFLQARDPRALTEEQVRHIHEWTDEHFRQHQLWDE